MISPRLSHILPGTSGDLQSRQPGSPCPMLAASKEPVLQAEKIRGGRSTQFSSHFRRGKTEGASAHDEGRGAGTHLPCSGLPPGLSGCATLAGLGLPEDKSCFAGSEGESSAE